MIVWILPGWESAHPADVLEQYGIAPSKLLAGMGPRMKEAWATLKRGKMPSSKEQAVLSIQVPRSKDYEIEFSKVDVYSPTFPEDMKLVKRSMFDVVMVTDKCPIHGRLRQLLGSMNWMMRLGNTLIIRG